jgi:1-acyl-sn-glycerol-3-phosphate acyltransferase
MNERETSAENAASTRGSSTTSGEVAASGGAESAARVLAAKAKPADEEILPIHDWIYWTMTSLFRLFFRLGGWKLHNRENVPISGAVILAPNHVSLFDPPLVGCASPRRVTTMGKAELFDKKWCGLKIFPYIIQHMATFPVKRGAPDRRAIRRAQKVLQAGEALVLFPEGTRTRSGELGEGEIGLAMIAHHTKAPIVPVYLKGTNAALSPIAKKKGVRFFKTEVFFGAPLHFESEYSRRGDRETLQAISSRVMQEIQVLKDRAEGTDSTR